MTISEWEADLILSGHLHGGIVRVPKLGGVITPQARLFPKYSGELTMEGEKAVVVSKWTWNAYVSVSSFLIRRR